MAVSRSQVSKLRGKNVTAVKKDGTVVTGRLVRVQGNRLIIAPDKGKQVRTKAIIPLVLFDLLAIGTAPYGYGGGYGGGYGYGPYGYGYDGYPGYFY